MGKRAFLSEADAAQILRRYSAVTVMGLLREVARCDNARLDWNVLVRKTKTGISSAREYQALWRHIAYRAELADFYADDAEPSDDESDLEFELLPSSGVTSDASAEVVRWVKADIQRFEVGGKKKGEKDNKSKSKDAGLPTVSNQADIQRFEVGGKKKGEKDNKSKSKDAGVPTVSNQADIQRVEVGGKKKKEKDNKSKSKDTGLPTVSNQADIQQFEVGGKKKGEKNNKKSKSRDVELPTVANQAHLSSGVSGKDESHKRASKVPSLAAKDSGAASPPSTVAAQISSATPECTVSRATVGQSERKKRKLWSQEEDQELISAVEKFGEGNWTNILKGSFTHERTAAQLSQRWALIRKRRESQAAANRLTSSPADGEGNRLTPPADPSPQTNPVENGGESINGSPPVLSSTDIGNGSVDDEVVPPSTVTGLCPSPGNQSQAHVGSLPNTSDGSTAVVTSAVNGSVATSGSMDSSALKGGVVHPGGSSMRAGMASGQRQAQVGGTSHSTSGTSTTVAAMAVGQGRSPGAKSASGGAGASRLVAPGAVVMTAAAAQAASVGGSEMWQAATLPTGGASSSGPAKYVARSNSGGAGGRGMPTKPSTGPDPGVQAAAVAAGARIAPASAAASLLKAAHSGNVVHITPGGVPITKSGAASKTGAAHNASVGSRGSSGANVHYICTSSGASPSTQQGVVHSGQRPAQQTKNQPMKSPGTNQTGSVSPNASISPPPNPESQSK